jgi:hypothetical protein
LYTSDYHFNLEKDKKLSKILISMIDSFPDTYTLIIPFYFDYYENDEWSDVADVVFNKIEKKYKMKYRIISPLVIKNKLVK